MGPDRSQRDPRPGAPAARRSWPRRSGTPCSCRLRWARSPAANTRTSRGPSAAAASPSWGRGSRSSRTWARSPSSLSASRTTWPSSFPPALVPLPCAPRWRWPASSSSSSSTPRACAGSAPSRWRWSRSSASRWRCSSSPASSRSIPRTTGPSSRTAASGFAAALPPLFFLYAGFESLAQTAGEVQRQPPPAARHLPARAAGHRGRLRAHVRGRLRCPPRGAPAGQPRSHDGVGARYLHAAAATFVTLGAVMALATSLNATMLVPSRMALVLVRDGLAPRMDRLDLGAHGHARSRPGLYPRRQRWAWSSAARSRWP